MDTSIGADESWREASARDEVSVLLVLTVGSSLAQTLWGMKETSER